MSETRIDNFTEVVTDRLSNGESPEFDTQFVDALLIPEEGISFYIMRIGLAVIVRSDEQFLIGRTMIGADESAPMLNLENLDGLATLSSVSRQHAIVSPLKHGYEITDLGSRNGTWIGGQRLVPHRTYPLASGDLLRVG